MSMRDWFLKDKAWKLFSLVLAVAIWLIVNKMRGESPLPIPTAANQQILPIGNVPVLVTPTPADARNFRVEPASVAIAVAGPPNLLSNLQPDQIHAFVDLTEVDAANPSEQPVEVSLPPGLTFLCANPVEVDVAVTPQPDQTNQPP
jgi:YbbR domain-containing protein